MGFADKKATSSSCKQGQDDGAENEEKILTSQKKPGGWKAMPFILGNETFERLASFGLLANFLVYLMRVYHLEQVAAANVLNIWSGLNNFAPLLGAFVSDTYSGRFKTIAFSSCAAFMVSSTLHWCLLIPHFTTTKTSAPSALY